ncbi:sulfatase [Pontiella sp.]|uniref:sulfatase family protein n=1 Tax=Pontiella sp. TaxID=2837462 RepID=UPI0035665A69
MKKNANGKQGGLRRTVGWLMVWGVCAASAAENRPNIVLMMADDLGWGDVHCFNPKSPIQTPQLDAMAAAGVRFDRFYSSSPVCSPTRGSCLTGRHPFRYGVYFANRGHMKPEELTLAELLRQQGYATGHFGKWHLGTLTTQIQDANRGKPGNTKEFSPPWKNGFEVCFSTESKVPTWDPMLKPVKDGHSGWDFIADKSTAVPYGTHYWNEKGEVVSDNLEGDDSRVIMDRVVPFIEAAAKSDRPFFAVVWFHAPHLPVVAGPEYAAMYPGVPDFQKNYYGCVTALDEQVGRLRAVLKAAGVAENTMVWFGSDNGPEGNAKSPGTAASFRGRKRSLYEGGVRVSGLLDWPARVKPGTVTDFPAVTSDYLPTILDALQVEYAGERPLDGISLLPVLAGRQTERSKPIGFESAGQVAWTTQRFKLYSKNGGKNWELYDLLADPSEKNNVAAEHPEQVAEMAKQLAAWRASCKQSDRGGDY